MTLLHWNLLAEGLGFFSGLLLLIPSLSLNSFLRDVERTGNIFKDTKLGKKFGTTAIPALQKDRIPEWSARDQLLMQLGGGLLALSFAIKFIVLLNSPTS